MNYFAHGHSHIDRPYFLAGTAVPDWLGVVDRRVRLRRRHVAPFVDAPDQQLADLARGILRHLDDDSWFHATRAFNELMWQLTAMFRTLLPEDGGFRTSFLGHILVEILLDDALIAEDGRRLERFYAAVARVDPEVVQTSVRRMAGRTPERLAWMVSGFVRERFLWDYRDDGKLVYRLNQVMQRVKLPRLPETFAAALPEARRLVVGRKDELLSRDA